MVEEEEGGGGGGHRRRHFLWRLLRPATERLLSVDSGEIVKSGGIARGGICVVPCRDPIAFGVSHFASSFFFLFHNCTFR